jgi:hypothetical protein
MVAVSNISKGISPAAGTNNWPNYYTRGVVSVQISDSSR